MTLPLLYPRPQWLREHATTGLVLVPGTCFIATPGAVNEAEWLCRWLLQDHGIDLAIASSGQAVPALRVGLLDETPIRSEIQRRGLTLRGRETASEGYLLDAAQEGILVAGQDPAGELHGLQTPRQLVFRYGGVWAVPSIELHDWPYKPVRGVHIYMPPRAQLPFFRRFLDFLSTLRLNTVFLEVGGGMRFARHLEINRRLQYRLQRRAAVVEWIRRARSGARARLNRRPAARVS